VVIQRAVVTAVTSLDCDTVQFFHSFRLLFGSEDDRIERSACDILFRGFGMSCSHRRNQLFWLHAWPGSDATVFAMLAVSAMALSFIRCLLLPDFYLTPGC